MTRNEHEAWTVLRKHLEQLKHEARKEARALGWHALLPEEKAIIVSIVCSVALIAYRAIHTTLA